MPLPIREEDLNAITKKVYALYATHGFDGISMDEISRQARISKATLYRYFTSKEEIVRGMVHSILSHLDSVSFHETHGIGDVCAGIRDFYVKSILTASLSGSKFLRDLKNKFPDCLEQYRTSKEAMQERFEEFYRDCVSRGYFRNLSFALVIRQFSNMLPVIIDMNYLEENRLSLSQALREYYCMFLCQILTEAYLPAAEREETYDFVEDLAAVLLNDCYIDTIRR